MPRAVVSLTPRDVLEWIDPCHCGFLDPSDAQTHGKNGPKRAAAGCADRLFTDDFHWLLVASKAQKDGLTKLIVAGPLGKFDLGNQNWLDPDTAFHDGRRDPYSLRSSGAMSKCRCDTGWRTFATSTIARVLYSPLIPLFRASQARTAGSRLRSPASQGRRRKRVSPNRARLPGREACSELNGLKREKRFIRVPPELPNLLQQFPRRPTVCFD